MAIFLTGSTGYIGAHVASNLLDESNEPLNLLVRAKGERDAREKLWRAFQLHMDYPRFRDALASRIQIFRGDLTGPRFGLPDDDYKRLVRTTDSVIHCAASLNRKSEKTCLNVNLRGTLQVVELAMRARDQHGLRRFSHVSTVAVAGRRQDEIISEDSAIEWDRSDYDPYARTKKFCEHMIGELLPDVQRTIFRPSIVLGDSRRPETNQFGMVKAFVALAGWPVLPFRPGDRIDIVPVDYVAGAVAKLHLKDAPAHQIYQLSSGVDSETYGQLTNAIASARKKRKPRFVPFLEGTTSVTVNFISGRFGKAGELATLLKVFLPYLTWNTVFDNSRVVAEMGRKPAPFSQYCYPLLRFSQENRFAYPYKALPSDADTNARQPVPQEIRK
ncbi:MAG TPA: SDR family oxidoreductase [Candidatus Acidoferrales bacterium]|nr:SDR family oxidoreductase [Candidatus Acidoferrales bacterium]